MTTDQTDPHPDGHAAEPLALRLNDQLGLAEDARLLAMARAAMPTLGLELDDDADVSAVRAGLLRMMRAAVAAERGRIDQLLRDHQGVSLETLEYLETMRQGPTREEWAEMDARARGDGEPGCRDCADNNGTCPHDGHKCGA